MEGINDLGYSTHVLGTVKSVMSCYEIVLYSRYDFLGVPGYSKISLYNIEDVYKIVKASNKKQILTRNNADEFFHYKYTESGTSTGFNVIIYVNTSTDAPLGYTDFSNTQGENRDIDIKPDLIAEVTQEDFYVILKDSLTSAPDTRINYLGEESYEYTSSNKVLEEIKQLTPEYKYTKFLSQIKENDSNIFLDSGLVKNIKSEIVLADIKFVKLNLTRNMNFNPQNYNFTNFNISYYGDDIVLSCWNGTNYCIASLVKKNNFGTLIIYTKSNTGYFTLPVIADYSIKIKYIVGKFIVCQAISNTGRKYTCVFNVEKRDWEIAPGVYITGDYTIFVDPLDMKDEIKIMPSSFNYEKSYYYLPSISNTYYNFLEKDKVRVIRKVGSWIFFKATLNGANLVMASNVSMTLYMTETEMENMMIVDDNTIMFKEENYYKMYRAINKTLGTSDAKMLVPDLNDSCILIDKNSELLNTPLNKLRRGAYPKFNTIPNIVTTFMGHLFYVDGNYINFL